MLLKEQEEKIFNTEEAAIDFFRKQEAEEIWKRCYTNELTVFPVPGESCFFYDPTSVRTSCNMTSAISDETIAEVMESTKLGISVPLDKKENYPMSQTAFATLMQRAGYAASPVISNMKSKPNQGEMSPINKANVLNLGLSCYSNKALVLIRDEKIRAVLSGDESDYSRLPVTQLYQKIQKVLGEIYPNWSFKSSSITHLFTTILVELNDAKLEAEIRKVFPKANIMYSGKPMLRMITSDVGLSGANILPVFRNSIGQEMALGTPLSLTHNNRHSVEDFEKNLRQITAMFREAKDKLEEMTRKKIKHPAGCLKVIAKKCGLPKKLTCNEAEAFEAMYQSCYEIDVYQKLYELLDEYSNEVTITEARYMDIQESIARIVFTNMSEYDYNFNWE